MTREELQEIVLTCIPSESLKRAIRERAMVFELRDLLTIACRYARSFDEQLRFLDLINAQADEETAEAAGRIAAQERKRMEAFLTPCSGEVYELTITEKGGYTHRALCATFDAAKRLHRKFLKEYFGDDDEERMTPASVFKRRIAGDAEKLDCMQGLNDEAFSCELTADGIIRKLYDDQYELCPDGDEKIQPEDGENSACDRCKKVCPHPYKSVVPFPEYLKSGDLIRWEKDGERTPCVWLRTEDPAPDDNIERYYVLRLNAESMIRRIWHDANTRYDVFFTAHDHPAAPEAEKIELSELDEGIHDIYEDFMRFYEEWEREKQNNETEGRKQANEEPENPV